MEKEKDDSNSTEEIEVTPEMVRAGLDAFRREGGAVSEFMDETEMI
jgi:hypothetical protein